MGKQKSTSKKNKKIICFVDETGTAGDENFSLGLVMAYSSDVSKIDKIFSDLLPAGFNEFHANKHDNDFVKTTIFSFIGIASDTSVMMFSHYKPDLINKCRETTYAKCLIEAVKASTKNFRKKHKIGQQINNIDVIVDSCEHNNGTIFKKLILDSMSNDGIFRGVNQVISLDSSVSRLIQLADAVAYMRNLSRSGTVSTKEMSDSLKIKIF